MGNCCSEEKLEELPNTNAEDGGQERRKSSVAQNLYGANHHLLHQEFLRKSQQQPKPEGQTLVVIVSEKDVNGSNDVAIKNSPKSQVRYSKETFRRLQETSNAEHKTQQQLLQQSLQQQQLQQQQRLQQQPQQRHLLHAGNREEDRERSRSSSPSGSGRPGDKAGRGAMLRMISTDTLEGRRHQQKVITAQSIMLPPIPDDDTTSGDTTSAGTTSAGRISTGATSASTSSANTTSASAPRLKAMYDFEARGADELGFDVDDVLIILDDYDENWWFARHSLTKAEGYVPKNYVLNINDPKTQKWFFGWKTRREAEKLLLNKEVGTFLIRESENNIGGFSLSVKGKVGPSGDKREAIKHYKISRSSASNEFFISSQQRFRHINDLVLHYSKAPGLVAPLIKPCPREGPTAQDLGKDRWEILREEISLQSRLGSGQFGEVWSGLYRRKNRVAVKTLKPGSMTATDFLREADIMKGIRHPKLVALLGVCSQGDPLYIISEYMRNGCLLDFLRSDETGRPMQLLDLVDMAAQCAEGMEYLEAKNLIHRDLAARNVLVGENNTVKVADFGLSRIFESETENEYEAQEGMKFPIKWSAPECICYRRFSVKSDIWSYGILLQEIQTKGAVPYPGMTNAQVAEEVPRGLRMLQSKEVPNAIYDMMLKCWSNSPEDRPTFTYLFDFFTNYQTSSEAQYQDS